MIEVRMFGVRERMDRIVKTKNLLKIPGDRVVIDEEHAGVLPTAKKVWRIPTERSHVLVLQDDVELCHDFLFYCETICGHFPDDVFSLFPLQFRMRSQLDRLPDSPYVTTDTLSGAGVLMPSKYIGPCLDSWDDMIVGDDSNIQKWAKENNVRILTTIPALIQHVGFVSVFNPSRSLGMTEFFWDPAKADWNDTRVESWTNIVRR